MPVVPFCPPQNPARPRTRTRSGGRAGQLLADALADALDLKDRQPEAASRCRDRVAAHEIAQDLVFNQKQRFRFARTETLATAAILADSTCGKRTSWICSTSRTNSATILAISVRGCNIPPPCCMPRAPTLRSMGSSTTWCCTSTGNGTGAAS